MSWKSKVLWSEGMFLQPQHLQQQDRFVEHRIDSRVRPLCAFDWGFRNLTLDEAALMQGKVQLASARGLMPDGTPFDFPAHDAAPPALEIPADAKDELVLLTLPLQRVGALDADLEERSDNVTRYLVRTHEVPDNTIADAASALVQTGELRLRVMLHRDLTDAYSTLGVLRVIERRADNQLMLDKTYIPPTLEVAENAPLAGYVRELHGLLHQRGEALGVRLSQPGRGGVAEIADFLLLQTVNRYEPLFKHFGEITILHPSTLYATCLMLAGDLCTFSRENRRPGDYPRYRHDDLYGSFNPLMLDLRRSLSMVLEQSAIPIELQDRNYGVRVAIIPDRELLRHSAFVLAVNAQIAGDALRTRFPTQVKIGPVERIRDLVNLQLPGIVLRPLPVAPRQIPYHAGFTYFELERSGEMWKQLQQSGGLAMHIAGEFPGLELECWAIRG